MHVYVEQQRRLADVLHNGTVVLPHTRVCSVHDQADTARCDRSEEDSSQGFKARRQDLQR